MKLDMGLMDTTLGETCKSCAVMQLCSCAVASMKLDMGLMDTTLGETFKSCAVVQLCGLLR